MSITVSVWAVDADIRQQIEGDLKAGRGLSSIKDSPHCSLAKTWSALHFVLTGTAWGGELPAAFLLHGGTCLIEPEDETDSPPRWIPAPTVKEIDRVLKSIPDEEVIRRCDVPAMVAADVYSVSERFAEDLAEELSSSFALLRDLVDTAGSMKRAIVISG